jgi:uncharacterized protein YggE
MTKRLIALIAGVLLLLAACGEATGAGDVAAGDPAASGISVSGQGKVTGVPDTLTLDLGVAVLRDTVEAATSDAAALADAILAALTANGVAEADVQTSNYSIWPEWDYGGDRQVLRGYRVTNTVTVRIRDLDRAGEIIDAATAAGGDEVVVNGLAFSIEDNTELLELARANAWNDAEGKAQQLARLAGTSLGAPISIVESIGSSPSPVFYQREEAAADMATPIEPGLEEVTVTIEVRFAIGG